MSTIYLKKTDVPSYVARYSKPEHIQSCYTCGTCNSACPVNAATSSLRPMELVYKAKLGLLEELLFMPDIWYCIGCNRCSNLCPMTVKPLSLIQNLRAEAILRKIVSPELPEQHKELLKRLLLALWHGGRRAFGWGIPQRRRTLGPMDPNTSLRAKPMDPSSFLQAPRKPPLSGKWFVDLALMPHPYRPASHAASAATHVPFVWIRRFLIRLKFFGLPALASRMTCSVVDPSGCVSTANPACPLAAKA